MISKWFLSTGVLAGICSQIVPVSRSLSPKKRHFFLASKNLDDIPVIMFCTNRSKYF